MKIKSKIYFGFLFLMLLMTGYYSNATHMIGGDITYECLGGNNYKITLTLYQDCLDGQQNAILDDNPAFLGIYENSSPYSYYNAIEDILDTTFIVPTEFSNDCVSNFPTVCMRKTEFTYYITLDPSEYGYTLVYQRCCRNHSISNINNPGNIGITYSAVIPPTSYCNNSAYFNYLPPQIICVNNPFSYDFSATDPDGDSLVYRLCESYKGGAISNPKPNLDDISSPPFSVANYKIGYSYDNPIPGFPPLQIDAVSGLLTMTPTASGRFQVKVCVDEYRDGILLNTLSRDLQFYVFDCSKTVVANTPVYSNEPNVYIIECGGYTVEFENTSTGGFEYFWDFGDGTTSTEFSPTHTYADTGTYWFTLVVNPGTTCVDTLRRKVKIYPYFTADVTYNGDNCPGDTINFIGNINSTDPNISYHFYWDFGDGSYDSTQNLSVLHQYDTGNTYYYTFYAKNELGCEYTINDSIYISTVEAKAGNDTIIVLGYEFYLNATGIGHFSWSPTEMLSNPNIGNPQVFFTDTGLYTFILTAREGTCIDYDTINVLVVKEPSILMPSAFSPNSDGLNDEFKPVIVGYPYINYLRVYDRWGKKVFGSFKVQDGWNGTINGKLCEQGVYFWELSVTSLTGDTKYLKGDVTLLR